MSSAFARNLEQYAELVVRVGLNLQPGQRLLIGSPLVGLAPLETAPLVRLIAAKAYQCGARLVDVLWGDEQLKLVRVQHAPPASLADFPAWQATTTVDALQEGAALLLILAQDPDLLGAQDPAWVGMVEQAAAANAAPIFELVARNASNWSVIAAPVEGWAKKVFPDLAPEAQVAQLWDAIFDICRVKDADPVGAWQAHVDRLAACGDYLNDKQYAALQFTGPGTDLIVGLPAGHIWRSARLASAANVSFTANLPTEEVFTMPHKDWAEGVVTATKPLSAGGSLIEGMSMTFAGGRVVKFSAMRGEEALRGLLATDEGAGRLGEVALVPHSSPVSQSGLTFFNILIDENAASHIAWGHAYKFSMAGGESMSDDEFAAAGGNLSTTHTDFMIGSGEVDVDGLSRAGAAEPLMRSGEWAFQL